MKEHTIWLFILPVFLTLSIAYHKLSNDKAFIKLSKKAVNTKTMVFFKDPSKPVFLKFKQEML